jgi:shikimate dehydrogenase
MKRYLGIIGDPIEHTLSPVFHQSALEAQRLNYMYLPFRVMPNHLSEALVGLRALGFVGVNVTLPHKETVIPYLDKLSREAELIGAVNTLHLEYGRWVGYNTDGIGFLRSLQEDGEIDPVGARILIIGAGGAARAVAAQLGLIQAKEIVIANRDLRRGGELAREMQGKIPSVSYRAMDLQPTAVAAAMQKADIIVNATPLGMEGYPEATLPVRGDWFEARHRVVDLVYRPLETLFLKLAKSSGAHTVSGMGMLLYQGVESYRIWTKVDPPVEVMREALLARLGGMK